MKKAFTIALTLFCASCAPVSKRDVSPLMDRMEQQLRLPSWAKALNAYARYYAYAPSGDVEALYTLPISVLACEEQVVSHDGQIQKQCLDIINGPKAGERRWVEDDRHFRRSSTVGAA